MDIPTLAAEVTGALVPALPRHHICANLGVKILKNI